MQTTSRHPRFAAAVLGACGACARLSPQEVLAGGQGHMTRVAESGQLLLDRLRHADVLEWLWWLTSHSAEPSVQLYK